MDAPSSTLTLPNWLTPQPALPTRHHRTKEAIELERTQFELIFDVVVEEVAKGRFLSSALRDYPIEIDYGRFLAWLRRDDERWARYTEAQQCGGEMILAKTMDPEVAAQQTIPDDPHIARLKFDKAKWYLSIIDRKRFGPSTQVSGDPDAPIEHRVVHSVAPSPLDDLPEASEPRVIEHAPDPADG